MYKEKLYLTIFCPVIIDFQMLIMLCILYNFLYASLKRKSPFTLHTSYVSKATTDDLTSSRVEHYVY